MIVDYDGRIVAQATPGEGEKIVVGPVDLDLQREERRCRIGHHMLAHLRTEAHTIYSSSCYPPAGFNGEAERTYEDLEKIVRRAKRQDARRLGPSKRSG